MFSVSEKCCHMPFALCRCTLVVLAWLGSVSSPDAHHAAPDSRHTRWPHNVRRPPRHTGLHHTAPDDHFSVPDGRHTAPNDCHNKAPPSPPRSITSLLGYKRSPRRTTTTHVHTTQRPTTTTRALVGRATPPDDRPTDQPRDLLDGHHATPGAVSHKDIVDAQR